MQTTTSIMSILSKLHCKVALHPFTFSHVIIREVDELNELLTASETELDNIRYVSTLLLL